MALADFYEAAVAADLPEATRLAKTIQTCSPEILVPSPSALRMPAPRASTGSSNRSRKPAADIGT